MRTRPASVIVIAALLATALTACSPASVSPVRPDPTVSPGPTATGVQSEDEDFGTATVYRVSDGALDPAPTDERATKVWDEFVTVATADFVRSGMREYRVGDAAGSDTLAYVTRDENDPTTWTLAANLAYADDEALLRSTLIHEYGHILSLGVDDVDPTVADCSTWQISEGCVREGSALFDFQKEFWAGYGEEAPTPESDDRDAAARFYEAHESDFVSDYAATNVVEDFAETFMTFVQEPDPSGNSPVARKLAFFSALPAYVAIRHRLRSELGLS